MKLSLFCFRWQKTTKAPTRDQTLTHQAEVEVKEAVGEARKDEAEKMSANIEEGTSNRLVESLVRTLKDEETDHPHGHLLVTLTSLTRDRTLADLTPDPHTNPDTRAPPDVPDPPTNLENIKTKSG